MKKICISKDWKFKNITNGTDYESVDLPHDYQIKEKRDPKYWIGNGFYPDKSGKYVKYLTFERGRHYILDIDGAYMCAHIMLNENMLAMHPYGYTPFLVDLTPHIMNDMTNKLIITTTPLEQSTRWYSGNGIYRDVFLWEGGDVRIEPWDIFVSTEKISDRVATMRVRYTVSADEDSEITVKFTAIYNDRTEAVKELRDSVSVCENKREITLDIPLPKLWDTDTPNLYTLRTEIIRDGVLLDETDTVFGIRTISVNAETGLLLNGKKIKLRGGCVHHDHGELGAAAFPAAEERKIRKLKEAGFNAIRCTHNPSSLALLEACDRLGMIAMDEAFDAWNIGKRPLFDYHLFFADWWARDISYMVLRDRNHPCIFSYSIGNEILEINGTSKSDEWSSKLACEIRKYDDTRPVTSGIQKVFVRMCSAEDIDPKDYREFTHRRFESLTDEQINTVTLPYEKPLDIVGLNYYYDRYALDQQMYPDRVIWGSETHAINFYHSWACVEQNDCIIGDFTWTAIDNMGEVGAGRMEWRRNCNSSLDQRLTLASYPWRNCYQGDIDLCGIRRPQSYFREAIWRKDTEPRIFTTHPEHYGEGFTGTCWHWYDVNESWSYDERYVGRPIRVETYTLADVIEWFVNGKKIGESVPEFGIAAIDAVYEKGNIRAVAYKNGKAYAEYTLFTSGEAQAVELQPEKCELAADGRDLCYVQVSLTDKDGRLVTDGDCEITCSVYGGELLAFFSANPATEDDATSNKCHTFKGRALAILRAKAVGDVTVTVFGEGLAGKSITVSAV